MALVPKDTPAWIVEAMPRITQHFQDIKAAGLVPAAVRVPPGRFYDDYGKPRMLGAYICGMPVVCGGDEHVDVLGALAR